MAYANTYRTENQIKHDILNIHLGELYHLQSQIRLHKTDTDYDRNYR